MARPQKYGTPTTTVTARLPDPVAKWLDEAQWSLRAKKTELIAKGLELYLALHAPGERPEGYELSPDANESADRLTRAEAAIEDLLGEIEAYRSLAEGPAGDPMKHIEAVLRRHGFLG